MSDESLVTWEVTPKLMYQTDEAPSPSYARFVDLDFEYALAAELFVIFNLLK